MEPRISCDCNKCKGACTVKPGWMLPGEAEKIAEHLGITLQELFDDFLLVDYYLSYQKGHKYLLSPALKGKKPGDMTPSNPMGVCIFFDEETEHCQIHEVAPYECQMYIHGQAKELTEARHQWIAQQWNHEVEYKQLVDLLGREPSVPEMDQETFIELLLHHIRSK